MLVLHYTGMESASAAIDWLTRTESRVSCHYVVDEEGKIYQLVAEAKRAWHAGVSSWNMEADINSRSIGIEIVNPGHLHGYPDFPDVQIEAVIALSKDIVARHNIEPRNVVGHSDIAPGRKIDPGEKFPWRKLHEAGVGHMVEEVEAKGVEMRPGQKGARIGEFQARLALYGYGLQVDGVYDRKTRDCVWSFQAHFRQSQVDGIADAGTRATLEALLALGPETENP